MLWNCWMDGDSDSSSHEVFRLMEIAAGTGLPVLLLGETGIGKEVAARTIHELTRSRSGPFVAVNCGSLNANLLESSLFGAVRGAYTGAERETKGLIRSADGGTLFLDEIGEMPFESQSRLLRTLQEKTVTPVGGQQELRVDFRLLCATHRNLEHEVALGRFREDLFFRIHAFPIHMKPLRERPMDIGPLARFLWRQVTHGLGHVDGLCSRELDDLARFPWPGNVRQLRNTLERLAVLRQHGVTLHDLLEREPTQFRACENGATYDARSTRRKGSRLTLDEILGTLGRHGNNKSRAAESLGISRGSLCHHLRRIKNGSRD